ncbi:hypothetical protein ACNSOP_00400 [Aliarcobacter lanthieri]|uniref:hypothetical protein n=1 Tax=Aliarcobacter lanthieri TaxID=1355374 RepID=UPI001921369E|nr:hypothetical protein [Aliarcobacter lanthieri]MBL3519380.1 hypothetical protein [Aliarcobacter lanthieri]
MSENEAILVLKEFQEKIESMLEIDCIDYDINIEKVHEALSVLKDALENMKLIYLDKKITLENLYVNPI